MNWKLISEKTGEEINVGDEITTISGERVRLVGLLRRHCRLPVRTVRAAQDHRWAVHHRGVKAKPIVLPLPWLWPGQFFLAGS